MPFLVAEILNFQGSAHHVGVGSLSSLKEKKTLKNVLSYLEKCFLVDEAA